MIIENQTLIVYGAGIALLLIITLVMIIRSRKKSFNKSLSSPYTEALSSMIDGDKMRAINKLKEAVKHDTGNIDAYLKLGDIFREYGKHIQALRVHQSLTIRKDMSNYQKLSIWKSLVRDYRALKRWESAIEFAHKIVNIDRKNTWARQQLVLIYKEKNDWAGAAKALKELQGFQKVRDNKKLALYHIQDGLNYREQGEEKESRNRFKKALKIDPKCAAAFYNIGRSYLTEDRKKDAVSAWRKFVKADPEHAYLVFDDLEDILFDMGNFDESLKIYQEIIKLDGDNISALAALADLYNRMGNKNEALETLRRAVDISPDSLRARAYLIQMLLTKDSDAEVRDSMKYLIKNIRRPREFDCKNCDKHSHMPLWICPKCLGENTFLN